MFCVAAYVRDLAGRGSALRDDRDGTGNEPHRHHPGPRRRLIDDVDEAEAVRADARHAELAAQLDQLLLQADSVLARLAEAGREHDRVRDARRRDVLERRRKAPGADEHDRQVDRLADLDAARDGLAPVDHAAVPVHEMQGAVEPEAREVPERPARPAQAI